MRKLAFAANCYVPIMRSILFGSLGLLLCLSPLEAKTKRLDNKLTDSAEELAKDREAAFAGNQAMPLTDFKTQWTAFAKQLDDDYQGYEIKLKMFGADVRLRKVYAHLLYMALRVQQGTPLDPSVQALVANHPFLQELILQGSCYTGGDPFPKKLKDLIEAHPDMVVTLRDHLDKWDKDFRQGFDKEFGTVGMAQREK